MRKSYQIFIALGLGTVLGIGATSASAHDSFSFGLNVGVPGYYAPPPVRYYAPPVTYYEPAPRVYYNAPPVVYYEQPRAYFGYSNGWGNGYRGYGYREHEFRGHEGWGRGGDWGHRGWGR